jgi:beta-glucosidase
MNDPRVAKLTLEQKVRLLTGEDFWAVPAEPAIDLRRLVLSDGPAGVRGELWDDRDPSANVPSPTALAASWDPERVARIGSLLAAEARRKGVDVILAPTVNLHRTPYGGRHFECFSEDPLLTGRIGVAYVEGVQSGGVGATVKHFVANDSETERFTVDARVGERALRELYLAPFEAIVGVGVWAVMAAYNSVNGTTMTEHPMLRAILHDEWGWDGLVMSDWFATRSTVPAANAALDLAMPGPYSPWGDDLVAAVRAGEVPESLIDDKVTRLLRLADRVSSATRLETQPSFTPEQTAAELRGAAAAGFVLARNAGDVLPLAADGLRSVAVVGPNAAAARTLGGGSATVFPPYAVSPLDGLRAALGESVDVLHAPGGRVQNRLPIAPLSLVTDPFDGTPGIAVRLLDEDGGEVTREHRRFAQLTWLGSFGRDVPAGVVAAVEMHARVTAEADGVHTLGCSGVGKFRVSIDNAVVFDDFVSPAPGLAEHESLLITPQWSTAVDLRAGAHVDVIARYEVPRGLDIAKLEFNVAPPWAGDDVELARAVELARTADAAVVVVGTTEEVESEGFDRTSLALPGNQDELVRAVLAANPRTVVVVNSGAPVLMPWAEDAPAIVLTWFPGQEFGHALADVLLGFVEPGGRTPVTWPRVEGSPLPSPTPVDGALEYAETIHIGHRAFLKAGIEPLFPFGHGLGYTSWQYTAMGWHEGKLQVTVRNTGLRRGRQVVQVYAERPDSAIERPVRWLVGFVPVDAGAGEEVTVDVPVHRRALEHWDAEAHAWALEPGAFLLRAGSSVADLPLSVGLVDQLGV